MSTSRQPPRDLYRPALTGRELIPEGTGEVQTQPSFAGRPLDDSSVAQHIAIEQLLFRYAHAIDPPLATPETLEQRISEVFHRDAVIDYVGGDYPGNEPTRFAGPGPDGWLRYFTNWRDRHMSHCQFMRHATSTPVVEIDGNQASSTSYLTGGAYPVAADQSLYISHGLYNDRLVKEGGRWWIKYRKIRIFFVLRAPPEQYRNG